MIAPIVVPAKAPNHPRKLEAHSELPSSFALSPLKGEERLFQCDFAGTTNTLCLDICNEICVVPSL